MLGPPEWGLEGYDSCDDPDGLDAGLEVSTLAVIVLSGVHLKRNENAKS